MYYTCIIRGGQVEKSIAVIQRLIKEEQEHLNLLRAKLEFETSPQGEIDNVLKITNSVNRLELYQKVLKYWEEES